MGVREIHVFGEISCSVFRSGPAISQNGRKAKSYRTGMESLCWANRGRAPSIGRRYGTGGPPSFSSRLRRSSQVLASRTCTAPLGTFTVTAVNQFGRTVSGYAGTVSFYASGVASLPAPTTLTDGTGTFSVTMFKAGLHTLAVTDGTISGQQDNIVVMPGSPAHLTILSGTPQTAVVNTPFGQPLKVQVSDAYGNMVSGSSVVFAAPFSGPSGTFGGTPIAWIGTDLQGVAEATGFMAGTKAGSFTVTAAATAGAATATFQFTNRPGSAAALAPVPGTSPQSATVGTVYAVPLRAQVTDAYGNPLQVPGVKVTFTAPPSGPSGTFAGSSKVTVVTNANGKALAPPFLANKKAGSFAVAAAASGFANTGFELTNTAGKPANILAVHGTTPQSARVGTVYSKPLQARVTDAFGNPVANVNVTFKAPSLSTIPSGVFGSVRPSATATVPTDANGVATAQTFTANSHTGTFVVTATSAGIVQSAKFSLTNTEIEAGLGALARHQASARALRRSSVPEHVQPAADPPPAPRASSLDHSEKTTEVPSFFRILHDFFRALLRQRMSL